MAKPFSTLSPRVGEDVPDLDKMTIPEKLAMIYGPVLGAASEIVRERRKSGPKLLNEEEAMRMKVTAGTIIASIKDNEIGHEFVPELAGAFNALAILATFLKRRPEELVGIFNVSYDLMEKIRVSELSLEEREQIFAAASASKGVSGLLQDYFSDFELPRTSTMAAGSAGLVTSDRAKGGAGGR